MKLTNSQNGASGNGKGEHQPKEVYENLDPGLWAKTDAETGESELIFGSQLPEEIRPETDDPEDDSPNPLRN